MEEFKRLPWPVSDFENIEESYALNISEYKNENPNDVFFCHLMDIDPVHYRYVRKTVEENTKNQGLTATQLIDPRTGAKIPLQECNYKCKNISFECTNIFLNRFIRASKLSKCEHVACLKALSTSTKLESELSIEEKKYRDIYKTTTSYRSEEKKEFLEMLRENFFKKIVKRYHYVPPSVEYFVTQNWKKQVITMQRQLAKFRYRMITAISLQSPEYMIKASTIHQEHMGNVPQMINKNVDYVRTSSEHLMKAYKLRKNIHLTHAIKCRVNELIEEFDVDFVVPISILKLILNRKKFWSTCITVKDSEQSTTFNPKKIIKFEKPLPPSYLSGNERYKKGAKYLLHSCYNQNTLHIFNQNDQIEYRTLIDTEAIDCESNPNSDIVYKLSDCEEFIRKYPKIETHHGNMTCSVFDINGSNDQDDDASETFRILVPAKQAAYKKNENGEIRLLNYSPKIEFQSEYGAETMSKVELIDEWCELYFRPNTMTERVRFDCRSGKMLHRQSFTLRELESELKNKIGIESKQLLGRLWHALRTFSGFPNGDYLLLQNDAKQSGFIKIYERSDSSVETIGISEIIKNISFERNSFDEVHWQPIDDDIVTKLHEEYQMLPCAFPHIEHLHQRKLSPPNGKVDQPIVAKKSMKKLKICPQDDSLDIIRRHEMKKKEHENQAKKRKNQQQIKKRSRKKAEKKLRGEAAKAEVDGLVSAKQMLSATMDQYNASIGKSFAQIIA